MIQEEAVKIIENYNIQKEDRSDTGQQTIGCIYALNEKYLKKYHARLFEFWDMVSFLSHPDIFLSLIISNIDELHQEVQEERGLKK